MTPKKTMQSTLESLTEHSSSTSPSISSASTLSSTTVASTPAANVGHSGDFIFANMICQGADAFFNAFKTALENPDTEKSRELRDDETIESFVKEGVLNLSFKEISSEKIKELSTYLTTIGQQGKSIELNLSLSSISDTSCFTLAPSLRNYSPLQALKLNSTHITDEGLKTILEALANTTSLTALDVGTCEISKNATTLFLNFLKKNKTLTALNYSSSPRVTYENFGGRFGGRGIPGIYMGDDIKEKQEIQRLLTRNRNYSRAWAETSVLIRFHLANKTHVFRDSIWALIPSIMILLEEQLAIEETLSVAIEGTLFAPEQSAEEVPQDLFSVLAGVFDKLAESSEMDSANLLEEAPIAEDVLSSSSGNAAMTTPYKNEANKSPFVRRMPNSFMGTLFFTHELNCMPSLLSSAAAINTDPNNKSKKRSRS